MNIAYFAFSEEFGAPHAGFVHTYNISTIWGLSRGIMNKCPGKQENSNLWSMVGYGNIVIYYTIIIAEVTKWPEVAAITEDTGRKGLNTTNLSTFRAKTGYPTSIGLI